MIPIPTADHDANVPPLFLPPLGVLVPVLLDGHRWIVAPPGDPVAEFLLDRDMEGTSHDPG